MQIALLSTQIFLSLITALHALLYKRDSRAAMSWIALCVFVPFFGAAFYYLFGINRVHYRAKKLSSSASAESRFGFKKPFIRPLNSSNAMPVCTSEFVEDVECEAHRFSRVANFLSSRPLQAGNHVEVLFNGEQAYPKMLAAIAEATNTVYLMTYIFTPNTLGRDFIAALSAANQRGVDVKVIIDGMADLFYAFPSAYRLLKKEGIAVRLFTTTRLMPPSIGINLRNHRKLLLVDEQLAFTGGMNITGINNITDPTNKNPNQDIQFSVQGPVLMDFYAVFSETWEFISDEKLDMPEFSLSLKGDAKCRVITDGPDEKKAKIELVMIDAVVSAKHTVKIMSPYFLPSKEMISALNTAAMRGVKVDIVLPEKSDNYIVDCATRNMLWQLLQSGVDVSYQASPFAHTKLLMIDSVYLLIGSANIDPRSLRLNYELMLEVFDDAAMQVLENEFLKVLKRSKQITLEQVDSRSLPVRIKDAICWLLSPYL